MSKIRLGVAIAGVAILLALVGGLFARDLNEQDRTQNLITKNNQQWCDLLHAVIQPDGPPPTGRGIIIVRDLKKLYTFYQCQEISGEL